MLGQTTGGKCISVIDSQNRMWFDEGFLGDMPGEHLSEVFVTRGLVMARYKAERDDIYVACNMVYLAASQNIDQSKECRLATRRYAVERYGREVIEAWLKEIDWPDTLDQLMSI